MSFINLAELKEVERLPGFHVRFAHSDHITMAYWHIQAGAFAPEHTHRHEQISSVVEGDLELTIAGETQIVKPGQVAIIPGNAPHSARAITNVHVIDVFYPVREDYRKASS